MRRWTLGTLVFPLLLVVPPSSARGADPPRRKPLSPEDRNAVLTLIKAVDLAQETDVTSDQLGWQHHVLKAPRTTAYVPFRIDFATVADAIKSGALYVRAVSRHDGLRAKADGRTRRSGKTRVPSVHLRIDATSGAYLTSAGLATERSSTAWRASYAVKSGCSGVTDTYPARTT